MISEVKETVYRVWTGLNSCKITTAQINDDTQVVNSLRDHMFECSPFWVTFFSSDQGRNQDFSKGGHTMSKWGYSPDCHVVFATFCRLFAYKRLTKGGEGRSRALQDSPSYAPVSGLSAVILTRSPRSPTTGGHFRWISPQNIIFFLTQNEIPWLFPDHFVTCGNPV